MKHIKNPDSRVFEINTNDIVIAAREGNTLNQTLIIQKDKYEFNVSGVNYYDYPYENIMINTGIYGKTTMDCMRKLYRKYNYEFYILKNFHELYEVLKKMSMVSEKEKENLTLNDINRFENPKTDIKNVSNDPTNQIILVKIFTDIGDFLGIVQHTNAYEYTINFKIPESSNFSDSNMLPEIISSSVLIEALPKFHAVMSNWCPEFYVIRNWKEMLCVLNGVL